MTGFGKASGTFKNKKISVEVKSLNSKNLDLYVRLLPVYKEKEIDLRKYIASRLDRGKIECSIQVEANGERKNYTINKELAGKYYSEIVDLKGYLEIDSNEDILATILKMPEIFSSEEEEFNEEEWNFIWDLLIQAIDGLEEYRLSEGKSLQEEFTLRINNIKNEMLQKRSHP